MKEYSVGESVNGIVSGITSFGAFIELENGGTGLIHISKLSRSFVKDVGEVLKRGDKVTATVIGVNGERIALSLVGAPEPKPRTERDFEKMLASFKAASDEKLAGRRERQRKDRQR